MNQLTNLSHKGCLISICLWALPFFLLPSISNYANLFPWTSAVLMVLAQGLVGYALIIGLRLLHRVPETLVGGLAHFLGGLGFSLPILFELNHLILAWCCAVTVAGFFVIWRADFQSTSIAESTKPLTVILVLALPFLSLFIPQQFQDGLDWNAVHRGHIDTWFFSLISHSLGSLGFSDSFWDMGTSLGYQWYSSAPPATFTLLTGVSANAATWGMYVPFLKLFTPLILTWGALAAIPRKTHEYPSLTPFWVLSILLYFGFHAFHPKYLLLLDFKKVFWPNATFVPGRPPELMATALLGVILLLVSARRYERSKFVLIAIVFLTMLIPMSKVSVWPAFGAFLGAYSIRQFFIANDKLLLPFIVMAGALGTIAIQVLVRDESPASITLIETGYFAELVQSSLDIQSLSIAYLIGGLVILYWALPKLVLLASGLVARGEVRHTVYWLAVSLLVVMLTAVPPFVLRIRRLSPLGESVDASHDLPQFIKATMLVGTVICVGFLPIVFTRVLGRRFKLILASYCFAMVIAGHARFSKPDISGNQEWESAIRSFWTGERSETVPYLAMASTAKESGQFLASSGIGPWWLSVVAGDMSGYPMSARNFDRAKIWDSLFDDEECEKALSQMRDDGVTHIIANPENYSRFLELSNQGHLIQLVQYRWVFELVPLPLASPFQVNEVDGVVNEID